MFAFLPESLQLSVLSFLPASSLATVAQASQGMNEVSKKTAACIVSWLQKAHFPASTLRALSVKENAINLLHSITQDRIVCVGGAYSEFSVAELSLSSGMWSSNGESNVGRDGSELVQYGGCLYSVGGEGTRASGSIDRFDVLQNSWIECSALARPVRQNASVVAGSRLLVIGGEDAESGVVTGEISAIEFSSLNARTSNWAVLEHRLVSSRKGHSAVIFNGKLWVAGGALHDGEITASVETLELDGRPRGFETAASMVAPRKNFRLVVLRDQLYAVGGDSNGTIESYDEYTDSWMLETSLPEYRRYFSVAVYENKICVLGGQDKRCKGLKSVAVYDVVSGDWGVDCSASIPTVLSSKNAGSGSSPSRNSGFIKNAGGKKNQSVSVPLRGGKALSKDDNAIFSVRNSEMTLQDFAGGFVCGQSIALSFANLSW